MLLRASDCKGALVFGTSQIGFCQKDVQCPWSKLLMTTAVLETSSAEPITVKVSPVAQRFPELRPS
jgi:hypothetical protein